MTESAANALACLPAGLTQEESEFVYSTEVLGMPARAAARAVGATMAIAVRPHVIQARETVKIAVRGNLQVTKEDATYGIKEAIHRAQLFAEPMTEIAGWDRLIKLHGLDAPQRIDINMKASVDIVRSQVRGMSDSELVAQLGAGDIIDGEFYVENP